MKILIAEDDVISRKVITFQLTKMGHDVLAACDGAAAWELFDRDPVRLIVSDWMMPNLDGLQLCRRVRSRWNTPYTVFIILTAGCATREDYLFALESGIDDVLLKPLNQDVLRTRLEAAERALRSPLQSDLLSESSVRCRCSQNGRTETDLRQRICGSIDMRLLGSGCAFRCCRGEQKAF